MINLIEDLIYSTNGKGMYEITDDINNWVSKKNITQGQLNLFIQHTSASLTIMENASPDVLEDINRFFLKLVPEDSSLYSHAYEGNDDSIFGECMNLENAKPIYETLSGWESPTENLTNYQELPKEAKDFISYIEDICEVPVKIISTGPDDYSTIER